MHAIDERLQRAHIAMEGWYCPKCDTNHPINMVCLPEQLLWIEEIKDWFPVGQKLTYFQ